MKDRELAKQVAAHRHGRVPRTLRRQQVLAEAQALFVERGYREASMEELARRMGVSKPVVYELAGSKEQLFKDVMEAVSEELTARMTAAVASEQDLGPRLHAGILAFLRFVQEQRAGWTALLSMEAGPGTAEIAALRRAQARLVAAALSDGGPGSVEPERVDVLAHAINGGVETVALWWQAHPQLTAEALAELLGSLYAPGVRALLGSR